MSAEETICANGVDVEVQGVKLHVCDDHPEKGPYASYRISDVPPEKRTPGASDGECARCHESVSISPAGRDYIAKNKPEIVCTRCAAKDEKVYSRTTFPMVTTATFREIQQEIMRRSVAERAG